MRAGVTACRGVVHLLYSVVLAVGFILLLPFYLWKDRRSGRYRSTFRERMGRLAPTLSTGGPSIWVHAVSVGEVLAARPLLSALKARFPRHRLVLSTTTVTGNRVARSLREIDGLFYAPFDFARPVRRVLSALDPALLVLVETEIWPNLIHEARRRGTRVAIVNGRISPRSFGRYRRARRLLAPVLAEVDAFLMQGPSHAERAREIGAPKERVQVTGNLKFDAPAAPRPPEALLGLLAGRGPLWVAGSTVAGEEEQVLAAYARVRARVPGTALVVAPRHPERFAAVAATVEAAGFSCRRRTQLQAGAWRDGEVLVLDTLGELAQVYLLAAVVFVGGSLVSAGGHNVLEAAVAGKAVVVGPHMENFQEIADQFRAEGALVAVTSADELAEETVSLLLDDARRRTVGERARALVDRNRGALARTVEALAELMPDLPLAAPAKGAASA